MKKLLLFLPLIFLSFYSQASSTQFPTTATARDVTKIFDCAENGKSYNIASVLSCLENRSVPYQSYKTTTCYLQVNRYGGGSVCNVSGGDYPGQTVRFNGWYGLQCPSGTEKNRENMCESTCEHGTNDDGSCREKCDYGSNEDGSCKNKCEFGQSVGHTATLYWYPMAVGNNVQYGCYYTGGINAQYCTMQQTGENDVNCTGVVDGHITASTRCSTEFTYTGSTCTEGDDPFWGDGDGQTDPEEPDEPTDPTHDPDDPTGEIEDPSVLPDDSTNEFYPPDVEDEPDVEEPDTDDSTDTAVVSAITGLNKDINSALNDLNSDINETQTTIANELVEVKGSLVDNTQAIQEQQINDNKIYNNTKALIQQANADITTAVNKNSNAVNGLGDDLQGVSDSLGSLSDSLGDFFDGSGFSEPNAHEVPELIFSSSDFISLNESISEKKETLSNLAQEAKGLISISTAFNIGSLTNQTFEVKGHVVQSGLQRFESVAPFVNPVIIFICSLTALYIVFRR